MSKSKTYSFLIQPQSVDFQYRITLAAISDILLTTAGFNADENGFGMRKLQEMDSSWVLLRFAVELKQFPEQYEKIQVETWIEDVGRASTTRYFTIRNERNEIIGNACSIWAWLDIKTRRAKDLSQLEGIQKFATNVKADIEIPGKIAAVEGSVIDTFKVKYSDIDINQHVNSVRYINWIGDCFSLDDYKAKSIDRFEINYMNEVLFGDHVIILMQKVAENDFRFEIRGNDKTSCRARITFN